MMDCYQQSEHGQAEILQISGGEPTLHPQIIEIINMAKAKKFKYIMLNTNGLRIAAEEDFAAQLHNFGYGFEVYLQFDGFSKETSLRLRGQDLSSIKQQAVANLVKYQVPMTLVSTVESGINEHELGAVILYGLKTNYIRGINIQPLAYWGKSEAVKSDQRLTISGITKLIEKQTASMIRQSDFIPLPCNVERVAITYLLKNGVEFIPITRNADIKKYLSLINNTFAFKVQDVLREASKGLINLNIACECFNFFKDFQSVIPKGFDIYKKDAIEDTFRISITSFVDAFNFDLQSLQKECVHIITPDLKRIPFSAYNSFHRRR
jgi:tetraether lipid synthase